MKSERRAMTEWGDTRANLSVELIRGKLQGVNLWRNNNTYCK